MNRGFSPEVDEQISFCEAQAAQQRVWLKEMEGADPVNRAILRDQILRSIDEEQRVIEQLIDAAIEMMDEED